MEEIFLLIKTKEMNEIRLISIPIQVLNHLVDEAMIKVLKKIIKKN